MLITHFIAVAVGLRVFTRAYVVGNMWADDWAMIAALVSKTNPAVTIDLTPASSSSHSGTRWK